MNGTVKREPRCHFFHLMSDYWGSLNATVSHLYYLNKLRKRKTWYYDCYPIGTAMNDMICDSMRFNLRDIYLYKSNWHLYSEMIKWKYSSCGGKKERKQRNWDLLWNDGVMSDDKMKVVWASVCSVRNLRHILVQYRVSQSTLSIGGGSVATNWVQIVV